MKFSISIEFKKENDAKENAEKEVKRIEKKESVDAYKTRNTVKCVLIGIFGVLSGIVLSALTCFTLSYFFAKILWSWCSDKIIEQKCQIPLSAKDKIPSFVVKEKAYDLDNFLYYTFEGFVKLTPKELDKALESYMNNTSDPFDEYRKNILLFMKASPCFFYKKEEFIFAYNKYISDEHLIFCSRDEFFAEYMESRLKKSAGEQPKE